MPVVLISTSRGLYDRVYKTLGIVLLKSVRLSLLHPKLNNGGGKSRVGRVMGKSRDKAKQKAASPQLKGYRSLLLLMVIICVGSGEAVWFSHNNDSEAVEGVNEVLDDGVVEGVSIEVC